MNRVCMCSPGGTINVQGPEFGRTFGRGAIVDFDDRVAPDVDVTWGEALAEYDHLFVDPDDVESYGETDVPASPSEE